MLVFSIGKNRFADKKDVHRAFYNYLQNIIVDTNASQKAYNHARKLLDKKEDDCKIMEETWDMINKERLKERLPPHFPTATSLRA
ncbi:hypothetical protein C2G38_2175769 [Gigaspora rosea]|uniref:Uncharacterized protein n=1 Tax=Gigaspora rosea TaxID=44941 RepID=A0A397VIB6_9GLOM|nr:hypothetical protein C2G38_2175769 [Gigaspora rosea]CAG8555260.1 9677_t:CDS:2 [Gigaspora rosea]